MSARIASGTLLLCFGESLRARTNDVVGEAECGHLDRFLADFFGEFDDISAPLLGGNRLLTLCLDTGSPSGVLSPATTL
jgi:hypothetical protein